MSAPHGPDALEREAAADYLRAAQEAAAAVIARYSTSFGWATRLLGEPVRRRTRAVYALVRVADEIVDGAAAGCGQDAAAVREALDDYERRTEQAMATGFSTDLVLHAFAEAARAGGITPSETATFFASMRMDLERAAHTEESFAQYVDGSAEVVGLMCLRLFVTDSSPEPVEPGPELVAGARRLGAAFQKVNFLRDLRADAEDRERAYFPGVDPATLDDAGRDALLDDIDADLAAAQRAITALPPTSRAAVQLAHDLFAELSATLRRTPAAELRRTRVRVPDRRKAVLVARTLRAVPGARLRPVVPVPLARRRHP